MAKHTRIGFVGVGGIANNHLKKLKEIEGVEIVGLCDLVEERVQAASKDYGGKVYTNYKKMIDEVDMDGMYVCIPPFAHSDAEILAAQKGIHLFVEKPVVMKLDVGLKILAAIDKAGVMSSVGHGMRYGGSIQALRKWLHGKTIAMVSARRWGNIAGGENHWWRVYEKSGGQLLEMAVHQLDAMRFLAGDIKEVYARYAQRATKHLPNVTVPDVQVVAMEFASGAVGEISTSCALNKGGYFMGLEMLLQDMHISVGREMKITPEGAANIGPIPEKVLGIDEAFITAIRTGDASHILCDYREGLKSSHACIAANESAKSGKPVACWNG
jgi:predicted dehydrogenase